MPSSSIIAVKVGGSTLGEHDTTLQDLVALQKEGARLLVVHGGGALITRWLAIHNVESRFVRGLRVTDAQALPVVTAVLAGLVNKELVAQINGLGGRAVGLSGADAGLICAHIQDPELGYVGEIDGIEPQVLTALFNQGYMPVVAPLGLDGGTILNINADTAAGHLARAVGAERLAFLTDVAGVMDGQGRLIPRLSSTEAQRLISDGAIGGGMIPKVEACLLAAAGGVLSVIIDGRQPHALLAVLKSNTLGTRVG